MVEYRTFGTFRFFLAIMVVVGHFLILGVPELSVKLYPYSIGNIAVMTFFVLSGFVISEANEFFYRGRFKDFLLNRFLRIAPHFVIALLLSIFIHWFILGHIIGHAKMTELLGYPMPNELFSIGNLLSNLLSIVVLYGRLYLGLTHEYTFVRYIWAVIIEIEFYIVIGLLYFVVYKRVCDRAKIFLYSYLLASILYFSSYYSDTLYYKFSFTPYFMLGVSMFYYYSGKTSRSLLGVIAALLMSLHHFVTYTAKGGADIGSVGISTLLFLVLLLTMWMLLKLSLSAPLVRLDRLFGDLSYPIYLNQYAVLILFLAIYGGHAGVPLYISAIFITIVVSYCVNLFIEPFTKNLRNKVRGFLV